MTSLSALLRRALRVIFSATICSTFDLEEFHRFAKAGIHTIFEGLQTSSRISAQNRFELRSGKPRIDNQDFTILLL